MGGLLLFVSILDLFDLDLLVEASYIVDLRVDPAGLSLGVLLL